MKKRIAAIFVLTFFVAFLLSGCAASLNHSDVASFADPMTENLLIAMNANNYSAFSKDLDSAMKNAVPKDKFPALISQIEGKIGKYVPNSKQFVKAYKTGKFTNVVYKAKFTNESSVTVRVVFDKEGGVFKVSGLWFDSPKLRKK